MPERRATLTLRIGSALFALSMLLVLAAPITIARAMPELTTRPGRHILAGVLGLISVAIMGVVLALGPVRRGERWAVLAMAIPLLLVAIPMLVVDATYVRPERLFNTLAPQVLGLAVSSTAWMLCWLGTRRGSK